MEYDMAITNQQIADLVEKVVEIHGETVKILVASIDAAATRDARNHDEFRSATVELAKAVALLQERQNRHAKNWDQLWKVGIVPVLGSVILLVLSLVLNLK
jgi:hypothetical protein